MDPDCPQPVEPGPDGAAPMPLQPRSLTIKELALDAVGATADLFGALTFGEDPSQPLGKIERRSAASTPAGHAGRDGRRAAGAADGSAHDDGDVRPPGRGQPDQLQTEIEFREGGAIFANGQQIQ